MACSAPSSTQDPHSLPTRPHAAPTRVAGALPAGCPVLARGVGVGTVLWLQRRLWLLFFRQLLRPEGQSMDPEDGCRAAEEGGVGAARLMPALCASRGCRGFWGMGLACMQLVNGGRTPAGGLTNQRICAATAHATCFLSRPSRIPSFCSPDAARFNKHIWHPPQALRRSPTYLTPLLTGQAVCRACGSCDLPSGPTEWNTMASPRLGRIATWPCM